MGDIIQTAQLVEPTPLKLGMPHYSDKVLGAHSPSVYADKVMSLSYVAPNLDTPKAILAKMKGYSNNFLPTEDPSNIPINLSVNLAVEQPIEWSIEYQYPLTIEEYLAENEADFGKVIETFGFTSNNIFAYSISFTLNAIRFAQGGNLRGLKFSPAQYNLRLSLFDDVSDPESLIPQYFVFNRNLNTEQFTKTKSETVDGNPLWDFSWTGSLA